MGFPDLSDDESRAREKQSHLKAEAGLSEKHQNMIKT